MKRALPVAACATLLLGLACAQRDAIGDPSPAPQSAPGLTVKGDVRSIRLPEHEPELPAGPGRETVQVVCATCHTTRYIMIQPTFSRETWAAEVTKMQAAYSAPVPPDKVGEIVDYLAAVRGPAK